MTKSLKWNHFDHVKSPLCLTNRDGLLIYVNHEFQKIFLPSRKHEGLRIHDIAVDAMIDKSSWGLDQKITMQLNPGVATDFEYSVTPIQANALLWSFRNLSGDLQLKENEQIIHRLKQKIREALTLRSFSEIDLFRMSSFQILSAVAEASKMILGWKELHYFFHDPNIDLITKAFQQASLDEKQREELIQAESRGLRMQPDSFFFLDRGVLLRLSPRVGPHAWIYIDTHIQTDDDRDFIFEFKIRVRSLLEAQYIFCLTMTDASSGLSIPKYFESMMAIECAQAAKNHSGLCLTLFDIPSVATQTSLQSIVGKKLIASFPQNSHFTLLEGSTFACLVPHMNQEQMHALIESFQEELKKSIRSSSSHEQKMVLQFVTVTHSTSESAVDFLERARAHLVPQAA